MMDERLSIDLHPKGVGGTYILGWILVDGVGKGKKCKKKPKTSAFYWTINAPFLVVSMEFYNRLYQVCQLFFSMIVELEVIWMMERKYLNRDPIQIIKTKL